MPPEHPPTSGPGPDPHDDRLHRLFSAFRGMVRPTPKGRRAAILNAVRKSRKKRRASPRPLTVIGAGVVQMLNLLAALLPAPADRPPGPARPGREDDHEQP